MKTKEKTCQIKYSKIKRQQNLAAKIKRKIVTSIFPDLEEVEQIQIKNKKNHKIFLRHTTKENFQVFIVQKRRTDNQQKRY